MPYEQGVIRPPSEASSILVRVTRNCPWNQCIFCPAYKGTKFSRRSVEEVKSDIDNMVLAHGPHTRSISTAFLQDADSLILPTADLLEILNYLKAKFPGLTRVTSYARANSMKRKTVEEYRQLKDAGLTRVHTGMESGSARVLKLIQKGTSPEAMVEGGIRVKESGISLSEYIMPGVGGRALSDEHAVETAKLLNAIGPDFIRVRTFAMHPQSPMQRMVEEGTFVPMADDEIVGEIRLLVATLSGMHSYFSCADFGLNLLMQVDGYLDEKKDAMLKELDRFLGLSKEQKQIYSLLRRSSPGVSYPLDVVEDKKLIGKVLPEIKNLESKGPDGFNRYIWMLMTYQLPQPQTEHWT
jgi:radical SAM superfamily enzyme